ncbi:hypothetical protein GBL_2306 [Geobacillus kaustophilus GBlys]|uniref:Uncharacterized protein n=1 Tax=Geobacillus kaustophilus GBlys TaxID=1337888 RepID=U2Y4A0_GEOKU|nr:hypothetical protein [Geobacillus sp. FW23]GAD14089.1 hypothetical protein GBL_2306 [Geobacillus kaustophilus GBlys]
MTCRDVTLCSRDAAGRSCLSPTASGCGQTVAADLFLAAGGE